MIFGAESPQIAVQKAFRLIQPQTGTCMQPTKMVDEFKRVVVWKNLLLNGRDYCCLWHTAEGWLLKGTVVGVLKDQRPMLASYEIHCDENWLTHRVQVERTIGSDLKTLSLSVENRGAARWTVLRLAEPQLLSTRLGMGCITLGLMLVAEFGFVLWIRGMSIRDLEA